MDTITKRTLIQVAIIAAVGGLVAFAALHPWFGAFVASLGLELLNVVLLGAGIWWAFRALRKLASRELEQIIRNSRK